MPLREQGLSSDRWASPGGALWPLASVLLRLFSSAAIPPSSLMNLSHSRRLVFPHSAVSSDCQERLNSVGLPRPLDAEKEGRVVQIPHSVKTLSHQWLP